MNFPTTAEFLEVFGLSPIEEDPTMAFRRYIKKTADGLHELEISFSAVAESFQVVLRYLNKDLITISSEKATVIELRCDKHSSGIHVVFNTQEGTSEASITLEPNIYCHWWTLR